MQAILRRCLARDLGARYEDVAELALDVAPLASEQWAPLAVAICARLHRRRGGAGTRRESLPVSSVSALMSRPGELPSARRGSRRTAAFVAIAIAGIALLVLFARPRPPPEPLDGRRSPVSLVDPAASASATATAATSLPDGLNGRERLLLADAPIEKVRAHGLRRVELEAGRATVTFSEWAGALEVEAELAGGATAHASITMDGPREVRLLTVPRAGGLARPRPAPAPVAAKATEAISTTSAVAPAPPSRAELHDNPYARRDGG